MDNFSENQGRGRRAMRTTPDEEVGFTLWGRLEATGVLSFTQVWQSGSSESFSQNTQMTFLSFFIFEKSGVQYKTLNNFKPRLFI